MMLIQVEAKKGHIFYPTRCNRQIIILQDYLDTA